VSYITLPPKPLKLAERASVVIARAAGGRLIGGFPVAILHHSEGVTGEGAHVVRANRRDVDLTDCTVPVGKDLDRVDQHVYSLTRCFLYPTRCAASLQVVLALSVQVTSALSLCCVVMRGTLVGAPSLVKCNFVLLPSELLYLHSVQVRGYRLLLWPLVETKPG